MSVVDTHDIVRYRGDTRAYAIFVRDAKTLEAIDITGYSFKLTVSMEENPEDDTNQEFGLTGTITEAVAGKVQFAPTANQADQVPGTYYYDIELTDGDGGILTVAKGRWIVNQDISK